MRRTLAQIAGITAPQRHREGGHVRGPGTSTSDSIPARLSDGEFVLPADTVRKVGVKSLCDLVHTTHSPVPERGKNHYANGDLAVDETKRANSFGDAAASSLNSSVSQIPTGGLNAPAADGSQDRWSNTETGRNLSNIASALPGSLGGAVPTIARTGGAISGGIDAATRLLNAGAGAAVVSAIPGAASAQVPTIPSSSAGAGRGTLNPASVNPSLPPPASPPRTLAGTNVSGDITINGQAPQGGGGVSPQNMAAADNLSVGQSQNARARLMAAGTGQTPGVLAPTVLHSGNDWASRKALENAATSASSITNNGGRFDSHGRAGSPERAAYGAMLGSDQALRQAQPGMNQAAMRENAGIQREGIQQAGETQRSGIRAEGVNAANQISSGRLKLEQIAAGYSNRSADRLDRAQMDLENAKTPEVQRSARERLMALAGKAPQNEWGVQVTPTTKNLDGSTTQGSVYRYNKATGETARVDEGQGNAGQAPARDNMVRGQVYQTRGGPLRWNGSSFERVG